MGVLDQTLQGHCAASRLPEQAFPQVPAHRQDLGVGVERKALPTGTAGTGERGLLARAATARMTFPQRRKSKCLESPLPVTIWALTSVVKRGKVAG